MTVAIFFFIRFYLFGCINIHFIALQSCTHTDTTDRQLGIVDVDVLLLVMDSRFSRLQISGANEKTFANISIAHNEQNLHTSSYCLYSNLERLGAKYILITPWLLLRISDIQSKFSSWNCSCVQITYWKRNWTKWEHLLNFIVSAKHSFSLISALHRKKTVELTWLILGIMWVTSSWAINISC